MTEKSYFLMHRPDLKGLPELNLPEGYTLRRWTDKTQADIEQILELYKDTYKLTLGVWDEARVRASLVNDESVEATFLIEHQGKIVGMASARNHAKAPEPDEKLIKDYPNSGYVHWVAVSNAHSGKGLGLLITAAVLRYYAENSVKTSAILQTQDYRLPAIRTYLKLGFRKVIVEDSQVERWRVVEENLSSYKKQ